MPNPTINEATSTDLRVIDELKKIGWKVGDTLLYQQEYQLTVEQRQQFPGHKSIKPDIVLTDLDGTILAVFENKLDDEKKALTKLRTLYYTILIPRFLYACSSERNLFYDTAWKGLEAGEFRRVNSFLTLEEMKLKIEQEKKKNVEREIHIDKTIAGGFDAAAGKERYFQTECINMLINKYKAGKQKMLVHMATGLGKTRTMVALVKTMLEYGFAKRVLFVVDRVLLAEQALDDGFSLISKEHTSTRLRTSNFRQQKNVSIHVLVIDTLENIYQNIPSTFYDLLIVDECHRSVNVNRKLIFDHFLCPRIGLTATPRTAIAAEGKEIPEADLEILDTYRLFGCETGEPDYQFDLARGIDEGFLAPYKPLEIKTSLTELAEKNGVEFSYVLDPDERAKIELDESKKLMLEQLNRKYISEEQTMRIAEEIKKNTEYGEKVILFGVSQAHCIMLANALNKVFPDKDGEVAPRYAETIISDNSELNKTLKTWFKKPNRKPYIAVSVDIMTTGVDIPCVRYIAFSALTKSVGKYLQMLGRGTRLDPKSGKFSFKILDFVGLCKRMGDNGRGTLKPNIKIIHTPTHGGTGGGGNGPGPEPPPLPKNWYLIDNPDPEQFIQRVWIHGDTIQVIGNIPIDDARKIFEQEAEQTKNSNVVEIKKKIQNELTYEPTQKDLELLRIWMSNPEIYLDEEQLKKIYAYPQGSLWEFFLHAIKVRQIPTPKERIARAFESYLQTYHFSDEQIRVLKRMKEILTINIIEKKPFRLNEIFSHPVYEQMLGTREEVNQVFGEQLDQTLSDFETMVRV
ncbi:MAG: DEAD/DEAH box helicase family protein [Ignavibacteriales bacterium]|nr:DEAD/DEAH box helicase family protein [Ignavibacteriales bacterium]